MSQSITTVYLHNGILCSRKKEGTSILHDSMVGTGEHYAKSNKPGNERQIPYNLTCKWNLIKQTRKHNRTRGKEINYKTNSDQKGGGRFITGKKGKSQVKEHV